MASHHVHPVEQPSPMAYRAPRTVTTLLVGRLLRGGFPDTPCRVRNVSTSGMLVECHVALAEGDSIAVELRSGSRLEGTVAWHEGVRAGVEFVEPVDLDLVLAEAANEAGVPRSPRFDVTCPARLSTYGRAIAATIENLSQTGARLAVAEPISPDTAYVLTIPGLAPRRCTVRWCAGEDAGIRFVEAIAFAELAHWLDQGSNYI